MEFMFPFQDTICARDMPIVNWAIIGASAIVLLLEATLGPHQLTALMTSYGVVAQRFRGSGSPEQIATLFTSMFLHAGWFHLIGNMWALRILGDNEEDRMGHLHCLLFYPVCGAVAGLAHIYTGPTSRIPSVGASGALSAALGAYLILFPKTRVLVLVPWFFFSVIEIPALRYLGFRCASQLFNGLFSLAVADTICCYGGTAWWARVEGFTAGVPPVKVFERRQSYLHWHPDEYRPR